jgi:hypothetical protein
MIKFYNTIFFFSQSLFFILYDFLIYVKYFIYFNLFLNIATINLLYYLFTNKINEKLLTVSVKKTSRNSLINEIKIDYENNWHYKHCRFLEIKYGKKILNNPVYLHYKNIPKYEFLVDFLKDSIIPGSSLPITGGVPLLSHWSVTSLRRSLAQDTNSSSVISNNR